MFFSSPPHAYLSILKISILGLILSALTILIGCTKVQTMNNLNKGSLSVSISSIEQVKVGSAIPVTFKLTNNSSNSIYFLNWGTPLESSITRDQFDIIHQSKKLNYQGIMIKRSPPTTPSYTRIDPNKSLQTTIDISNSYDFNLPGTYTVTYKESFLDIKGTESLNLIHASNTVTLSLTQ